MRNEGRRLLPLLTQPLTGGRQSMTCKYRCADQCAQPTPNTSDNAYFGDVVADGPTARLATSSPTFAPQVSKVFAPRHVLTTEQLRPAQGTA